MAAVDDIDMVVPAGGLVGLVGPSGCGKSTLLRLIAGLVPADSGTIRLGGKLVENGSTRLPPEGRSIGLVFQEHALFPHLTVEDNVAFGVRGKSNSESARRVAEMLELVGLSDFARRFPHEMSGGERQRVALARALAPRPALMLFDEPFASLDHNLRVGLRRDVVDALAATDTPAILVTHDQHEALALGDEIAVMQRGRIVQMASPSDVFHRPASRFVAGFLGEASFLPISRRDGSASTPLGPVAAAGSTCGHAMVRPDDVSFVRDETGNATVVRVEYLGSEWLIEVDLGDGATVLVSRSHLEPTARGDRGRVELVAGHRQVAIPKD